MSKKASVKSDILIRLYAVFALLCFVGFLILGQALRIQVFEGEELLEKARVSSRIDTTEGERGNLYSANNKLLATSLPFFELRLDTKVASETIFLNEVDSLSYFLARAFKDKTQKEYLELLKKGRRDGKRYLLLKKDANYMEMKLAENWPILKYGPYKGGFIARQYDSRVNPFKQLAQRTIGYVRKNSKPVGIEGAFNSYLSGAEVAQSMYRVNGEWVPMFDDFNVELRNGKDVYTTIDIDMQDKVESVLMQAMLEHQAKWGCIVIMEVATGKIKAIANLGLNAERKGLYRERYNYAVGYKSDPGSTFKVASLVSLLNDGFVSDSSKVNLGDGVISFYDHEIKDSWYYPGTVSVRKMIEISSNVGISKLLNKYYGENPQRFIDNLSAMGLDDYTGVDVVGEKLPTIKSPNDKDWSGITLPWMSMGHELELTPLQMLNFVNAVANDGKLMRPYLVTKIGKDNDIIERFYPQVLREEICSRETARLTRSILEGVVRQGTAKKLFESDYPMGGKTGTAEIAIGKKGYDEDYQASFVGFYPVAQPVYSAIVVINEPSTGDHYGGSVAGPLFKDLVMNCMAGKVKEERPINRKDFDLLVEKIPIEGSGYYEDFANIYESLDIPSKKITPSDWITPIRGEDTILLKRIRNVDQETLVPNVMGMGLRDAIYKLENRGLKVRFTGKGKVTNQSPKSGQRFNNGEIIVLELG